MRPEEAKVFEKLQEWNLEAAEDFKNCIINAQKRENWQINDLELPSEDALSNVSAKVTCCKQLQQHLSRKKDADLNRQVNNCINRYQPKKA